MRFEYTQVAPADFGMTVDDILRLDDKSLNKRVSLKKLAPYIFCMSLFSNCYFVSLFVVCAL